jgi:hypothetical protein
MTEQFSSNVDSPIKLVLWSKMPQAKLRKRRDASANMLHVRNKMHAFLYRPVSCRKEITLYFPLYIIPLHFTTLLSNYQALTHSNTLNRLFLSPVEIRNLLGHYLLQTNFRTNKGTLHFIHTCSFIK